MSIVRREPWGVFSQIQNDINRVFEQQMGDNGSSATADWAPVVDIFEYTDRFVLNADLPGVDPTAAEITLDNGVLTISGAREQQVDDGPERQRLERLQGRFYRRFTLPDSVETDKVTASSRNGVLTVTIPKRAAAQPMKIQVAA